MCGGRGERRRREGRRKGGVGEGEGSLVKLDPEEVGIEANLVSKDTKFFVDL